ncbi:MAG: hypothetical protein Q4G07_03270 [Oscillospiraceae bacterium]|nr:hypothetical protein [Oscillospiraceae bacterium]
MKKIALVLCVVLVCGLFAACGGDTPQKSIEGTAEEILNQVYEKVPADQLPMTMVGPIEADMSEYYLGVSADRYKEAASGDAMINAVAHSVCVVRANSVDDVDALKKDIEAGADPRKWICVEAEKVIVDSIGDTVILIMSDAATADAVHEAFLSLGK